jgi:hypothetical protein
MHDCPGCKVPLHGHEEICPSCGTKQPRSRRSSFASSWKPDEQGINVVPFVLVFIFVGIFIACSLPNSWIGQLMTQGKRAEDPMEKLTYLDARNAIETQLTQGLTAAGAKGKFQWQMGDGSKGDKSVDGPVQLTIDTSLSSPELRKQIIDPVKPYMEKAKLFTLTMNDAKSHATWTYNMTPGRSPASPDAGLE